VRFASLRIAPLSCAPVRFPLERFVPVFNGCHIHGISAWDVKLSEGSKQLAYHHPPGEPTVTVDDLEVAPFIYLLLRNDKL
jgi:hypothetical protein